MTELQQSGTSELFYLKWSNFQMNVSSEFKKIQEASDLVDITFSCDGKQFGAHKLVLFACSPYFKEVLKKNPCSHPVFFINGVKSEVLRAILDFMYMGEVHINNEDLVDFIEMAEQFKIRGVTKDQTGANARRHDINEKRKHKKMRFDDLSEASSVDGIIEPKSEIEFGEQSCQSTSGANYGAANVDYANAHQKVQQYDDAGPSSVPAQAEQWLDDKHFMSATSGVGNESGNNSNKEQSGDAEQQRCKTKNYKALEPCSCPLCARVYSNVSNLRQHMRLIHNPTSVCCPLCQKSFTSDLYLKRHYLSMHGSQIPPAQANPTQQPTPQQPQTPNNQPHTVDTQKQQQQQQHVNSANAATYGMFGSKREYADLQTNPAANTNIVDSKQQQQQQQQQQMTAWTYDSKVE